MKNRVLQDGDGFAAYVGGRHVATFNSRGAAAAGIEVERRRLAARSIGGDGFACPVRSRSTYEAERQRTRDRRGRYEEKNRCDLCGKPWKRDEYQQISDDKTLQSAVVAAGGPAVGCVCHKCIRKLLPE